MSLESSLNKDIRRVSVIIPTYNRSNLLERAIRTVLSQTYPNFELIVVDDASTDSTTVTVSDLAKKDSRIRYIKHETNRGAQASRLTGVQAAREEFIAFHDSDDEWYPSKLEKQIEAFDKLPASVGVVHGDCDIQFGAAGSKRRWGLRKLSGSVYVDLLSGPGPVYPCLMVRRKCFIEIPDAIDPNVPSYDEWDTTINLALKFNFHFIDEPLMCYHIHEGETISKNPHRDFQGYLYVIEKHRDEIIKHLGPKTLANHYFEWALKSIPLRDPDITRSCFKRVLEYGPGNGRQALFAHVAVLSPFTATPLLWIYRFLEGWTRSGSIRKGLP